MTRQEMAQEAVRWKRSGDYRYFELVMRLCMRFPHIPSPMIEERIAAMASGEVQG